MKLSARMSATGCAALALAFSLPAFAGGDFDRPEVTRTVRTPRAPEPTFKIESGIDGDVFPAFANYASLQRPDQRKWGVVAVKVASSSDTEQRYRIAVRVAGWSDEEIQIVTVPAGVSR